MKKRMINFLILLCQLLKINLMWKDFQKILEKRVRNTKTIKDDKYVIIGGAKRALIRIFGEMGINFIEIKDYKTGVLWVDFKNSTWRNEFKLQEKIIIEKINRELNQEIVNKIILL